MCVSDQESINNCLNGRAESYRYLVNKYQGLVTGIIQSKYRTRETDDIVQEGFVRAYQKLKSLKNQQTFLPWLIGITRRVMLESSRREIRHKDAIIELASMGDCEARARSGENDIELEKAVHDLPEIYRNVILLRYYRGLSCQQIADKENVTLGTITKRLSRAYQKLRVELGMKFRDE